MGKPRFVKEDNEVMVKASQSCEKDNSLTLALSYKKYNCNVIGCNCEE